MKAVFLSIFVFIAIFSFDSLAQKDGEGKTEWGNWTNRFPCFQGFESRARCLGYIKSINKYLSSFTRLFN